MSWSRPQNRCGSGTLRSDPWALADYLSFPLICNSWIDQKRPFTAPVWVMRMNFATEL
jgi:hypothetical protein